MNLPIPYDPFPEPLPITRGTVSAGSLRREGAGFEYAYALPHHQQFLHLQPCVPLQPHLPTLAPWPGQPILSQHGQLEHLWGQKGWAMTSLFPWSPVCKEKQKNEKERHRKVTENLAVCKRETYNPQAIRAGRPSRPTSPTFRRHCFLNCPNRTCAPSYAPLSTQGPPSSIFVNPGFIELGDG